MAPYAYIYLLLLALPMGFYVWGRRRRQRLHAATLEQSRAAGLDEPPSLHPVVNPANCIGSGSCVKACPEGALGMVGGKATLVNASACIGHGACQPACPFDAIALVFGTERRAVEIPPVTPEFESTAKGIFIAGELGGMGLVRKAAEQGRQAMNAIHARCRKSGATPPGAYDVVIVGCGPAGLSAGLAAKSHGLRYLLIEQEDALGGAVYHYPRHKITMTSPFELALVGKVRFGEVRKEKLLEFWLDVVRRSDLQIQFGERMNDIVGQAGGGFVVRTTRGEYRTRHVLLALGRRGSPRKLGVPGEESSKVVYRLIDAAQYAGQHVMVVGGGDSALEAAVTLGEQVGTTVTLSYRGEAFSRVKPKNRERLQDAQSSGRVTVALQTQVRRIADDAVELTREDGEVLQVRNDAVIVCAGGLAPIAALQRMGIHFEAKHGKT